MTRRQRAALCEIAELTRGYASSSYPAAPFPTIRALVAAGYLAWTREPTRREELAPAGWTGHTYVEWLYAAEITEAGRDALARNCSGTGERGDTPRDIHEGRSVSQTEPQEANPMKTTTTTTKQRKGFKYAGPTPQGTFVERKTDNDYEFAVAGIDRTERIYRPKDKSSDERGYIANPTLGQYVGFSWHRNYALAAKSAETFRSRGERGVVIVPVTTDLTTTGNDAPADATSATTTSKEANMPRKTTTAPKATGTMSVKAAIEQTLTGKRNAMKAKDIMEAVLELKPELGGKHRGHVVNVTLHGESRRTAKSGDGLVIKTEPGSFKLNPNRAKPKTAAQVEAEKAEKAEARKAAQKAKRAEKAAAKKEAAAPAEDAGKGDDDKSDAQAA